MGQRLARFRRETEDAHGEASNSTRDPVAIKVERRPVGGADVLSGVHRHAVDDGVEILLLQSEAPRRPVEGGETQGRAARKHPGDVSTPTLELRQALRSGCGSAL